MLSKSTIYLLQNSPNNTRGYGSKAPLDRPDPMSRYAGGQMRLTHPYVSGYWYAVFKLPKKIFGDSDFAKETETWLHSTVESFNPPTVNPIKVDIPALGGMSASFIAGNQVTRTFSCEFREYMDTPVSSTISAWNNVVDRYYGASTFSAWQYVPAAYKGFAVIFLCKPSVSAINKISLEDIERAFIFEGVFPETNPYESFNADISTNDALRFSITFSFDGWSMDKDRSEILAKGLDYLNEIATFERRTTRISDHTQFLEVPNKDVKGNASDNESYAQPGVFMGGT